MVECMASICSVLEGSLDLNEGFGIWFTSLLSTIICFNLGDFCNNFIPFSSLAASTAAAQPVLREALTTSPLLMWHPTDPWDLELLPQFYLSTHLPIYLSVCLSIKRWEKEIFYLLVHSPNIYISQGCAKSEPEARNSILFFHVGGRDQLFEPSSAFPGTLGRLWVEQGSDIEWGHPKWRLKYL